MTPREQLLQQTFPGNLDYIRSLTPEEHAVHCTLYGDINRLYDKIDRRDLQEAKIVLKEGMVNMTNEQRERAQKTICRIDEKLLSL